MESLSSSICRACRFRLHVKKSTLSSPRTFATSSTKLYIPPESPAFVEVPEPHQAVRERRLPTKGLLPVPRELFPRSRPDKPSDKYLQNVTRDALPKNIPPPEFQTDAKKYKLRMSEMRKAHLREGLTQLHERKVTHEKRLLRRTIVRNEQREGLINQAEREDERLTNNTVLSTMKPKRLLDLPAEQEKEIYEARTAKYEALQSAKREARLDKLHTLYMHARHFITTKEQLAAAIDVEFEKPSIWRNGLPSSLKEMITGKTPPDGKADAGSVSGLVPQTERFLRDQERMKRIAEKLSGGKM
ncbi:uncharacterized protein A1O9_10251 [Exophiala aquamarina CBS 119918]|uniref:Uncharacterized protein n=1 Tax=Exophiala aquamarina CBS 119918 TaxID=1182545 RepID=A0A072P160_9EURO|nr:uncharacterized protein A1O9_10251 [Exophiala aquamarina CBS 119918]KEF53849.1 hypothetical protein A1O9_10251 [Exophiala aquamarina CBS 119918]